MTQKARLDRRAFLSKAAIGGATAAAGATLAAPAIAQENPTITWRMPTSFPKSLDILYSSAELLAKRVSEATDGKFQIQPFAAGEIVPAFSVIDSVADGTVQAGWSVSYYNWGKDEAYAVPTAVPFSFSARAMFAYTHHGGGLDLFNEFFATQNLHYLPGGNTGVQMGGWFRKEINTLEDLKGLKMRTAGIAGRVLEKLGVIPQQIPAGDIYPALEKGALDAVEFVGPADDLQLGFHRVAPYYYYPGFWEGGPAIGIFMNKAEWENLPATYQSILRTATQSVESNMLAMYDYRNPPALKELVAAGAQLRPFSAEILMAGFDAANEVFAEISAKNEWFKRLVEHQQQFRDDWYLYNQTAESSYDGFMMYLQSQGKLKPQG